MIITAFALALALADRPKTPEAAASAVAADVMLRADLLKKQEAGRNGIYTSPEPERCSEKTMQASTPLSARPTLPVWTPKAYPEADYFFTINKRDAFGCAVPVKVRDAGLKLSR